MMQKDVDLSDCVAAKNIIQLITVTFVYIVLLQQTDATEIFCTNTADTNNSLIYQVSSKMI